MSSDRQLGLLWGLVALCVLALAPFASYVAGGLPPCPLKTLTAVPCPGCGTTRAALALGRLDIAGALRLNPLATLGWLVLVGGGLVAGARALRGRGVPNRLPPLPLVARFGIAAVLALNWLYVIRAGV